jgi:hypothetical protein
MRNSFSPSLSVDEIIEQAKPDLEYILESIKENKKLLNYLFTKSFLVEELGDNKLKIRRLGDNGVQFNCKEPETVIHNILSSRTGKIITPRKIRKIDLSLINNVKIIIEEYIENNSV